MLAGLPQKVTVDSDEELIPEPGVASGPSDHVAPAAPEREP